MYSLWNDESFISMCLELAHWIKMLSRKIFDAQIYANLHNRLASPTLYYLSSNELTMNVSQKSINQKPCKIIFTVQTIYFWQNEIPLGIVYFKVFTSVKAATKKSAERLKKKLCLTLMTPKETERSKERKPLITPNLTPNLTK